MASSNPQQATSGYHDPAYLELDAAWQSADMAMAHLDMALGHAPLLGLDDAHLRVRRLVKIAREALANLRADASAGEGGR